MKAAFPRARDVIPSTQGPAARHDSKHDLIATQIGTAGLKDIECVAARGATVDPGNGDVRSPEDCLGVSPCGREFVGGHARVIVGVDGELGELTFARFCECHGPGRSDEGKGRGNDLSGVHRDSSVC